MALDKRTQEYALIGGVVLLVIFIMRHVGANTPATHETMDSAVGLGNTPFIRTGFVKHYPANHDYWWCQAQNEDVSLSAARYGKWY